MDAPFFSSLREQPADGLLALMLALHADNRPGKIDLGIGVYRDESGNTPVMAAVKEAERRLVEHQPTKTYVGVDGDLEYVRLLAPVALGAGADDPRLAGMQTPGGTGALRLAAELVATARGSDAAVWIGQPSWANHAPIFRAAGVAVRPHPLLAADRQRVDLDAMLAGLEEARAGDALLLHGCCHNPAGVDFTPAQWEAVADLVARRRLLPIVDLAYQGLGRGLEEDAFGLRLVDRSAEAIVLAYSCDKNFGLYRERTGALWVRVPDMAQLAAVRSAMRNPARAAWSMPPDHGAAVVRTILATPPLAASWRAELETMRRRIAGLRQKLAFALPPLAPLSEQTGMFSLLPLPRAAIMALRADHGIYIADDGRANLAGLNDAMIAPLVEVLRPYLDGGVPLSRAPTPR